MIVMTRESDARTANFLLQAFLSLDTPEGYRAQLIDGEIVVTPPPSGNHEHIIGLIVRQVFLKSAVEMHYAPQKGLIVPDRGIPAAGRVIPDATFTLARLDLLRDAPPWMEAAGVALVLEVTSSQPDRDRDAKRRSYAGAAIPLYLLADQKAHQITLFSDPADGDYSSALTEPIGGSLKLPPPFSFVLETREFPH